MDNAPLTPAQMLDPPVLGCSDVGPRLSRVLQRTLVPDDQMFPCIGNLALAKLAYTRYMTTTDTVADVARFVGVPEITALRWADIYGWAEARGKLMKVRERDERHAITMMRLEKRKKSLDGQIKAGAKLRDAVKEKLDAGDGLRPSDLKSLGDALKAAAEVEGRGLNVTVDGAAGVEDTVDAATADGVENHRRPLVVVVQGGGMPAIRVPAAESVTITQNEPENPA